MAPTHKDGLSEDKEARILFDDDEEERIFIDVPVIILKVVGLVTALFLALIPASPKVGLIRETFMIPAAVALTIAVAWAAWFETLIYRALALFSTGGVIFLIIVGIAFLAPGSTATVYPIPPAFLAVTAAIILTIIFITKRILYPKWDFFLPATAVLCIIGIFQVL